MAIQPFTIQQRISQLANQCVLCGICIPHCPSYRLFRSENESPRGRITLIKALAEQNIAADQDVLLALDHCLFCRACEKVCPSRVDYTQLTYLARQVLAQQYPGLKRPIKQKVLEKILLSPAIHPWLSFAATRLSAKTSLLAKYSLPADINSFSKQIAASTPNPQKSLPQQLPKEHYRTGQAVQVLLFKGCSSTLFEQQLINDLLTLLDACHINVLIPEQQFCCGAISARHAKTKAVQDYAQKNIEVFQSLLADSQAVISLNNSCSAHLQSYAQILDNAEAREFANKTIDAIGFLAQTIKTAAIQFVALDKQQELAVHIPCSLKNVLRQEQQLFDLLSYIPDIKLYPLSDNFCCGAAGSYMLQYPDIANALLDDKLTELEQQSFNILLSSNIGCSLHFKQGLEKLNNGLNQQIEILHPVSLLARQLKQ